MKTSEKIKVLEDEIENLCELAGETLATCVVNLRRKRLRTVNDKEFGQYLKVRVNYLKEIKKRLRAVKG